MSSGSLKILPTNYSFTNHIYLMDISKVTLLEGDPKAPFSIAITPRCWGGCYFVPRTAPLTFDPHIIILGAKQGGIKYHFLVFGMTRPGIEL